MKTPNILWICTDQQRFDSLSCCGHPTVQTPHLDRIARQRVRFTRHTTPSQICAPSRATMLTGLYPRTHGLVCNGIALDATLPLLPNRLAEDPFEHHNRFGEDDLAEEVAELREILMSDLPPKPRIETQRVAKH
jgi:arylsulfatase A-like enzyme